MPLFLYFSTKNLKATWKLSLQEEYSQGESPEHGLVDKDGIVESGLKLRTGVSYLDKYSRFSINSNSQGESKIVRVKETFEL